MMVECLVDSRAHEWVVLWVVSMVGMKDGTMVDVRDALTAGW